MEIKYIDCNSLKPYDKNAKKHDDTQVANVAESIRQYGFVQPIVIDRNNVVVIGHCRLLAAKKLEMRSVPCISVDDLTEEQVKALFGCGYLISERKKAEREKAEREKAEREKAERWTLSDRENEIIKKLK